MIFYDGNLNEITEEECLKIDPRQVVAAYKSRTSDLEDVLQLIADPLTKDFNRMLYAKRALEDAED